MDRGSDLGYPERAAMVYRVTWEVDIEGAESAREAAIEAEGIMLDYAQNGHRPVFDVRLVDKDDKLGPTETVDLEDDKDCAECGEPFFVTEEGVAHHLSESSPDGIDHTADGDHVAYE